MKKIIYYLLILILLFITIGCNSKKENNSINNNQEDNIKNNKSSNVKKEINTMKVIINKKEYIINLEDNETVKSFISSLPQELNMNELNGNEKYIYLDKSLPTNSENIKRIKAGDVMLYGNNCLVIFYKSFNTSYSYTKIGHIDNLPDLGDGNIKVTFEK